MTDRKDTDMTGAELDEFVASKRTELGVPGAAVGVWNVGEETFACQGVTSLENPLTITPETLFAVGSISKTFTATALMSLVDSGRISLEAPVRRYVPEFTLAEAHAADRITVMNLANHTAGLPTRLGVDTGEGDDALERYIAAMATTELIAAPGERPSYSQMGYNLLGLVIERVLGVPFERAVLSTVLRPLRLEHSAYFLNDVITKRFAMGHNATEDGDYRVVVQWKDSRANNPGGGLASSAADLLRWSRFHLGDLELPDGAAVLSSAAIAKMQSPTVGLQGSSLGDAIGVSWFIRRAGDVFTVGHGGSGNGQFAEILLAPQRGFAVVALSNAGPDSGLQLNQSLLSWAVARYLGVVPEELEPLPYDRAQGGQIAGTYENEIMRLEVVDHGGRLTAEFRIKSEVRAASPNELPPDLPPAGLGLLSPDECMLTEGGLQGQRGALVRDDEGKVVEISLAGRLFSRVRPTADGT
jgi:CubicO group peptidase (beta-lactamase class C family)